MNKKILSKNKEIIKCVVCNMKFIDWKFKKRKFCCIKCKGKFYSGERSIAKRQEIREKQRKRMLDEKNPQWKGDKVGIDALHEWIINHKPKSFFCEKCGKISNKLDCANISGKYKRDISDFRWLCRKCHMKDDGRMEIFLSHRNTDIKKLNKGRENKRMIDEKVVKQ